MTTHCPRCKALAAVRSELHCKSPSCPWFQCECGATFERNGSRSFHPDDIKKK